MPIKSKTKSKGRKLPRPFKMLWGQGLVTEEAYFVSEYHEPAIQLLEFEDGSEVVRFCFYRKGSFSKNPLMLGKQDFAKMKKALAKTKRLKKLLKAMF